jgi:hypothetical protein
MTLQNLLKIGRLKPHAPTTEEIRRLLAAERNLGMRVPKSSATKRDSMPPTRPSCSWR